MHGVRRFDSSGKLILLGTVADPRAQLAGDVLDQAAAEKNIQRLNSIADGQDGFARGQRVFEQSEIGSLARGVGIGGSRVALRAIVRRIDICGAPGQQERVQIFRLALHVFRTGGERKQHTLAAGAFHGTQVFVDFGAVVRNFLRGGTPRYADARAGNNLLGHGRSHRSIAQQPQQ